MIGILIVRAAFCDVNECLAVFFTDEARPIPGSGALLLPCKKSEFQTNHQNELPGIVVVSPYKLYSNLNPGKLSPSSDLK